MLIQQNNLLNVMTKIDNLLTKDIVDNIYKNGKIRANITGSEVCIKGNTEGILYLCLHLLDLAKKEGNDHFHFDQYNGMEEGSDELIFEKI